MSKLGCAVITGAGQGNGRAMAFGLAREGWAIAVLDLDFPMAEKTAEDIRAEGFDARAYHCDVADADQCEQVAAAVRSEMGTVAALVNNAGIVLRGGIDDDEIDKKFDQTFLVNVKGMLNVSRAFLPDLRKAKGAVVNLGSIASFIATPNNIAYNSSKGAVKLFTQSLAMELAADGVRVNAIAPGFMETRMTQATRDDADKLAYFLGKVPLGRAGQPEELIGAAVFLLSESASYVTGITLPVDGGLLAG